MKSSAETRSAPPTAVDTAGTRRARAVAAATAPAGQGGTPIPVSAVRLLSLDEGIYALRIGELAGPGGEIAGMVLPAALVSAPVTDEGETVDIIASFPGQGPWLGREGGTVIVRPPPGGGQIIVTAYGMPGAAGELRLALQRLDDTERGTFQPEVAQSLATASASGVTCELPTEILLHIERTGDRLFPGAGWVGALGRRMRVEAFSIRPLEALAPADIELKGLLPNGDETAWTPGGTLCGTRGRGLALVGFAVRIAPPRADRFEALYQGSFFAGGISASFRNGEPCRSTIADDPLEAINVRLIDRMGE